MASFVRQPRAIVTLNGIQIEVEEVEVGLPKKAHSGTCNIKSSLTKMEEAGAGLNFLAEQTEINISISINGASMFTGTADKADIDLGLKGLTVNITGRDASSKMTDKKTNEKFTNQTSQQIAQTIAGRHGLSLDSDGGTTTSGALYLNEQAQVTVNQSEWTLLRLLGEAEGKVPVVSGNKLSFKSIDDGSLPTYAINYTGPTAGSHAMSSGPQSGVVSIKLGRNYQAAKKTTVNVKSWDYKKKQVITGTASSGSGEPEQVYDYHHHQRTQDQVNNHAKSKLKEHTRHEFDLTIEMPGDESLTPFFQISLSGTNSGFDQTYNIDHVSHKLVVKSGYTMTISTKAAKKGRNS